MSLRQQNTLKGNINPLVILSIIGINIIYRKFLKPWKAKFDFKKRAITICSFHPSCSEYGVLALKKHGFYRGWIKTFQRIKKCKTFQHDESCIDYP